MVENDWMAGAETTKETFEGLLESFGVDYLSFVASGGNADLRPPFLTKTQMQLDGCSHWALGW